MSKIQKLEKSVYQKVALCYLLHFVQDGSSKNVLENCFLRKHIKKTNIGRENKLSIPPIVAYPNTKPPPLRLSRVTNPLVTGGCTVHIAQSQNPGTEQCALSPWDMPSVGTLGYVQRTHRSEGFRRPDGHEVEP